MKLIHLLALMGLGAVVVVGADQYRARKADRAEAAAAAAVGPAARVRQRAPAGEPAWGTTQAPSPPVEPVWNPPPAAQAAAVAGPPAAVSAFRCDGRTHCSQMTSCAEAEYFLRNCPNTKMDGNNDGEPCEQQWCN